MTQHRWFAIKSLYRTTAKGRPKKRDEYYQSGVSAVEERIVLFTAKNHESALKKAITEAKKYAKSAQTTNRYEQDLLTEFLGILEVYELFDPPGAGVEIHSHIEIAPSRKSTSALIKQRRRDKIDPSHAPQFIAKFISEELDLKFGSEWPCK